MPGSGSDNESMDQRIHRILGAPDKGTADALSLFAETKNIETIEELISSIRMNFNDVGNLDFETSDPQRHEKLGLHDSGDMNFDKMTVVVARPLVDYAIEKFREDLQQAL